MPSPIVQTVVWYGKTVAIARFGAVTLSFAVVCGLHCDTGKFPASGIATAVCAKPPGLSVSRCTGTPLKLSCDDGGPTRFPFRRPERRVRVTLDRASGVPGVLELDVLIGRPRSSFRTPQRDVEVGPCTRPDGARTRSGFV